METQQSANLMEGLLDEITRVSEMIIEYRSLPKEAGRWAASMMSLEVEEARKAIVNEDTVQMIYSLKRLKEFEN